jgi:hypothetical protein
MHALTKFRQYLVGNKFMVKTDHNSLKYFLEQKDLSEHQQKWVMKVQAFDFDIEYVKGKKNILVDALSRRPTACSLMEISTDWKSHLLVEYSKNKFTCEVMDGRYRMTCIGSLTMSYSTRIESTWCYIRGSRRRSSQQFIFTTSRPSGFFQNLQKDHGEVLMEGHQT